MMGRRKAASYLGLLLGRNTGTYGMVRESYRESNRSQPSEHFLLFSDRCDGDLSI